MDATTAVLLASAIVVLLVIVRVPVAFSLLIGGFAGLVFLQGQELATVTLGRLPYDVPSDYVLIILPLFIAMGVFTRQSQIAEAGFAVAAKWLRRVPGGLAVATILACAAFAAVSGSSVATVSAMGPMAAREMREHGYDKIMSLGAVAAAGTLGVLIPPSVVLVIYGIVSGESIGRLLLAGIIPGILSALVYIAVIVYRGKRHPEKMGRAADQLADTSSQLRPSREHAVGLVKIALLFVAVMGTIYAGIASTTEAAALGAGLALIYYLMQLRKMGRGNVWTSVTSTFGEATRLSSMAFALLIGASAFTHVMIVGRVPQGVSEYVAGLSLSPTLIVIIILLLFIPMGMVIDPYSIMLIAVPILHPAVTALGFDGIWFGILTVKMIEIGLITPPFGINVFVVSGVVPEATVPDAFRGALWFLPADLMTVMLLFVFPILVIWLPATAG